MKILALEFSSPQRSVAVINGSTSQTAASGLSRSRSAALEPDRPGPAEEPSSASASRISPGTDASERPPSLQPVEALSEVIESGGRGANALGMVEEALRQAQLEPRQVDCLAVGIGPGSYTGIRAVIALAQGWQLAAETKLLAISSADCIAAQAQSERVTGSVAVIIDAQRGEYYCANYVLTDTTWRLTQPLRLAAPEEVREQVKAGHLLIGPEVARRFAEARTIHPRAAMLGRLALGRTDFVPGCHIEPIYLRATTFVKAPPPRRLT